MFYSLLTFLIGLQEKQSKDIGNRNQKVTFLDFYFVCR